MTAHERLDQNVETLWREAEQQLAGLDGEGHALLSTATGAIDLVWDRQIFECAETFGGTEIGFARAQSGAVLARLINADYAALVSVAGSEIPQTGDTDLDAALATAAREALDTFSDDLLGPVNVGSHLVYAQPMLADGPIPIGAVVLATPQTLSPRDELLLQGFLRDLDTRLDLAERVLALRRKVLDHFYEIKKLKGEVDAPEPAARQRYVPLPEDAESAMAELVTSIPMFDLFGVALQGEHFEAFCRNYDAIATTYLKIFDEAKNLYLDVPSGVDAKDAGSKHAAAYHRLLKIMESLRPAARLLYLTTADDLVPYTVAGQAPTFADLTRVATSRTEDENTKKILELMNDQSEELELDALAARQHPFEFRAANIGEVFALLALHKTVSEELKNSGELKMHIIRALRGYQAARAYLLAYDSFENVPLKGADRTQPPAADTLLLVREKAPAFGVLLAALTT
ncbi:MAG: hypothetical protein QNL88_01815 [Acidobacteriota bacterium]|nr:hypothetical protein [Acidobacteriota bacterium]